MKTSVKANAAELLDKQLALRARKNEFGFIVLSSATDPYLHFEKETRLTRSLLEIILKHRFPVHIITKSDLVLRDVELLKEISARAIVPYDLRDKIESGLMVTFSFSGVDEAAAKIFESGATLPAIRLSAMKTIASHQIHTGVSLMPLLPFITDTAEHLEKMFTEFINADAKYAMPATLSVYGSRAGDSRTLMLRAVAKHYPHLKEKYDKWFAGSDELPSYYRDAFAAKMKELSLKYNLPDRIIPHL